VRAPEAHDLRGDATLRRQDAASSDLFFRKLVLLVKQVERRKGEGRGGALCPVVEVKKKPCAQARAGKTAGRKRHARTRPTRRRGSCPISLDFKELEEQATGSSCELCGGSRRTEEEEEEERSLINNTKSKHQ